MSFVLSMLTHCLSLAVIRYPRIGAPIPQVAPFYFTIGSVESFERKLEQVQRDMGIHPRDFIPVQYINETNWAAELVSSQFKVLGNGGTEGEGRC